MKPFEDYLSLILSLIGSFSLVWLFSSALISPEQNTFILKSGVLLFLVEFLSVHSSVMAMGVRKREEDKNIVFFYHVKGPKFVQRNPKFMMVFIYSLFILTYALIFKNWFIPVYFFISLLIKFYGNKATHDRFKVGLTVILFVVSFLIILPFSGLLSRAFPIEEELIGEKIGSGLLVDVPQVVLAWGVLYFFLGSVIEGILFFKKAKPASFAKDFVFKH